jgi:4-hydroxy-tetrahydrodipicolinate synthase
VYDAFVAGRVEDASKRFGRLWDLVTYLFADTNPVPCKAAMAALGLCSPRVRLPLAAATTLPTDLVKRSIG